MSKTETQTPAENLAREYRPTMPDGVLHLWAVDVVAELRRLDAENKALRSLAATCYAGLGAECNLPENWLDALNAAANGEAFDTDGLLPFAATEGVKWPKDAKEVREFFASDFISATFAREDQVPCDDDRYFIAAHDFLSAIDWWADFPNGPRAPQAAAKTGDAA